MRNVRPSDLDVADPEHAGRRPAFGRHLRDDVVERRPAVLERDGRRTEMVHAARRSPAAHAAAAAAAEPGTAAQRCGRRHEEVAFGGRPRRRGRRRCRGLAAERDVAQARGGRRGGGRAEGAFVGRGARRREKAARPALLDGRNVQRTVSAAERGRGRGRSAGHAALGHGGGSGRAHSHGQHRPAGARGTALVQYQRLDVGRGLGLARSAGHQRAVGRGRRATRARQRAAAREHRVLPRPDLQRPVSRLTRLEYGRRFQAAVHVELGERRPVLKREKRRSISKRYT